MTERNRAFFRNVMILLRKWKARIEIFPDLHLRMAATVWGREGGSCCTALADGEREKAHQNPCVPHETVTEHVSRKAEGRQKVWSFPFFFLLDKN